MPSEQATALVLRSVEFSETSLVVTLFTREFGKRGALAKGGKRLKGPFESALDLLALCRIVFLRKSSDALDLLTEAKLLRRFRPPPGDLLALYAGYYLAELVGELTDQGDPNPELFDLADRTLEALATARPVAPWLLRFELGALRLVGHVPLLDSCVECGRAVGHEGRVALGTVDGGVFCPRCRGGKRQVVSASPEAVAAMLRLVERPLDEEPGQIDARVAGELRGLLNRYVANLVGHPLRMHRYLAPLWKR